ncbi:hypothetical protein EOL70_10725 [Leucothrix sargassi]|nr:hypothetical protein EOL70_10725 [Leucothrix sargassi]
MKNLTSMFLLIALPTLTVTAQAADEELVVFDSIIIQEQYGLDLKQEASIATVSGSYSGKVTVVVSGSTIVQLQSGSGNMQRANIGTVTCHCSH